MAPSATVMLPADAPDRRFVVFSDACEAILVSIGANAPAPALRGEPFFRVRGGVAVVFRPVSLSLAHAKEKQNHQ